MLNVNTIITTVYYLLKADTALCGMCTVYRGAKRPINATNPSITVTVHRMAPGAGEGCWMGDVVVTVFVKLLTNGTPDHVCLDEISDRVVAILTDTELKIEGIKVMPLIYGGTSCPEWDPAHDKEAYQESTFGLVFTSYKSGGLV